MNKKPLLALLSVFAFSACEMFSTSDQTLPEGFSGGDAPKDRVIEFFEGDKTFINGLGSHVSHEITFVEHQGNDQPTLKTEEEVKAVIIDSDNVITSITDISNVNQLHGLKIGNYADAVDGGITFKFNKTIIGCQILAKVRASTVISGGVINHTIDSRVAINANGSKYIAINCDYLPENYEDIKETVCCYSFENNPTNELKLNVVYQRLEITKITIYE